ncbi:Peptidase S33, prolyl aminopeptidase [Cordyceps fumosorosea ARSEF 2679]|uniref:Peptidase S33, prolyl aminopeptidase n=1 Tax=Cordyceps fumosorosea (strain ARSEF 2679) TaxID=1081104 RepID=A0A162LEF0_CORFA|nr:Peptidase S33, prolyl aminopeptidase [Cordyceps fumosorosea ARSEF 2679]OAA69474.1 Peptidase S33, prolyl aminopeptidase [Cordyceps fumosorosea ARSEF 2679]
MAAAVPAKLPILSAKLLSSRAFNVPGKLIQTELWFEVPLDYAKPANGTIKLFGRLATRRESPLVAPDQPPTPKPYIVYLQGGPGFGCSPPNSAPMTEHLINRGYQVLYLDHRGVGLSTPVSLDMLRKVAPDAEGQAGYLRLMRQDNTVRDLEAVRLCLTAGLEGEKAKWSIIGQSYGGFVSLSYLSMHPEGLREAYLTGGLAPVGRSIDEIYKTTFAHTAARNKAYYEKFPEDVERVKKIAAHIESKGGVALPGGGTLTVARLMTIGISFGVHDGFDSVHNAILALDASLESFGFFSRSSLTTIENWSGFDNNIIYAILHEAIYCDGPGSASNWSAQRVGESAESFSWLRPGAKVAHSAEPLFFSGEMIFRDHFETYSELAPLREAAEKLASADDWPALYDQDQLRKNEVPLYAVSYVDDMFVDYGYATATAHLVKGAKFFATNALYHNGIRAGAEEVFKQLFSLRDDTID